MYRTFNNAQNFIFQFFRQFPEYSGLVGLDTMVEVRSSYTEEILEKKTFGNLAETEGYFEILCGEYDSEEHLVRLYY